MKPNLLYQLEYLIELAKRKAKPAKVVDHKWLMEHPEALTYSIKHLWK